MVEIVDEYLLCQLLGPQINPHELSYELSSNQPLRRFGLVHSTSPARPPFTGLAPDPLVLSRLRAEPLERDPAGALEVVSSTRAFDEFHIPPDVTSTIRAAIYRQPTKPLRIVVRGRDGSGRRSLLASLAGLANRRLAVIHVGRFDEARPTAAELRRALRRCAIAGWIPCIDGIAAIASDDRRTRDLLAAVIAEFLGPVAIRLERDGQPPIEAGCVQIDLPECSETERLEIWCNELNSRGLVAAADELAPVAARWRVGPGTIHRVVAHLTDGGATDISRSAIDRAVSQHIERRLGDVAERVRHSPPAKARGHGSADGHHR